MFQCFWVRHESVGASDHPKVFLLHFPLAEVLGGLDEGSSKMPQWELDNPLGWRDRAASSLDFHSWKTFAVRLRCNCSKLRRFFFVEKVTANGGTGDCLVSISHTQTEIVVEARPMIFENPLSVLFDVGCMSLVICASHVEAANGSCLWNTWYSTLRGIPWTWYSQLDIMQKIKLLSRTNGDGNISCGCVRSKDTIYIKDTQDGLHSNAWKFDIGLREVYPGELPPEAAVGMCRWC